MGKRKKTGNMVSGDPRKFAAAKALERAKKEQPVISPPLNDTLDEMINTDIGEKSVTLAQEFIISREKSSTAEETVAIKRFFLMLTLSLKVIISSNLPAMLYIYHQ